MISTNAADFPVFSLSEIEDTIARLGSAAPFRVMRHPYMPPGRPFYAREDNTPARTLGEIRIVYLHPDDFARYETLEREAAVRR